MHIIAYYMFRGLIELCPRDYEDNFSWSDGTPWDSAALDKLWGPGQPNDSLEGEDCVNLYNRYNGFLNDAPCSNKRPFVCKTSLTLITFI